MPPSNCALITPVELDPVSPGQSCGLTNQHYFPNGPTTSMFKEIIILCCIVKELMWKMIGPSLSFKGHIIAQTKAAHQRREAESICPSSELAPIKSEHSSQGHLASMFIGLCKDKCTRVYECKFAPLRFFPRDFETDIMGLLRKNWRRN